jgi:hypothetical protein
MLNYEVIFSDNAVYSIMLLMTSLKVGRRKRFENTWLEELLITKEYDKWIDDFYS